MLKITRFSFLTQKFLPITNLLSNVRVEKRTYVSSNYDFPSVSVSSISSILSSNGFIVKDGFNCLRTKCPICKSLNINTGESYINKVTGFFLCTTCDNSGEWSDLEKIIKNPKDWMKTDISEHLIKINKEFLPNLNAITKETISFTNIKTEKLEEIFYNFHLPILPEIHEILPNARISTDNQNLYFPLVNSSDQTVGFKIISHDTLAESTLPENDCSGLFHIKGTQNYSKEHPVIIVPSIGDALSVTKDNIPGGVICLPYGLSRIPQQLLPALEKWPKFKALLRTDDEKYITNLSRKIGESRCSILREIDSQPFPTKETKITKKFVETFKDLKEDILTDLKKPKK